MNHGGQFVPDLTGSDRGNIDHLLDNIINFNDSVALDRRMNVATLKDGRVITGLIGERNRSSLVICHVNGEERLSRGSMRALSTLKTSLMPEGLFKSLKDEVMINLVGYLRAGALGGR
jgi:putative heme-binding domain-containing protein